MSAARLRPDPRGAQVDALRGFALFGILVVNIGVFASPYYGSGVVDPVRTPAGSRAMGLRPAVRDQVLSAVLVPVRLQLHLQMAAAERGQAAFLPRFLRRLAGLAALGARMPCCSITATSC